MYTFDRASVVFYAIGRIIRLRNQSSEPPTDSKCRAQGPRYRIAGPWHQPGQVRNVGGWLSIPTRRDHAWTIVSTRPCYASHSHIHDKVACSASVLPTWTGLSHKSPPT